MHNSLFYLSPKDEDSYMEEYNNYFEERQKLLISDEGYNIKDDPYLVFIF